MNISNRFLQKYYPTRKLYVWALALIYIAPISLLAAQQKEDKLTYGDFITFIKQDLKTLYTKQSNNGKITENDLKSTWAKTKLREMKSNSPDKLIDALKKDHAFIIKAASTLLIENGGNDDTSKQLNLLTEGGIGLIEKKDFKLDGLTLEILAGFYKNKDNIKIIVDILEAQNNDGKKKVTHNIMEELKKGGNAWEQLKKILDYNYENNIHTLNLSYETINIPFECLLDHIRNKSCEDTLSRICKRQFGKEIEEIAEKALGELHKLNGWLVLSIVLHRLPEKGIKKKLTKFKAENYLKSMKISSEDESIIVLKVARKIIKKSSATAKRFAQEAFKELETLKDKESIENIWKILSKFRNSNAFETKELKNEAQQLVNKALIDNNQKSVHLWKLLYFFIADKNGPKVDSKQIAKKLVNKALIGNNQKFEHFWELLYFFIVDKNGPKVDSKQIAEQLVSNAFTDNNQNSAHFWDLLYFLIEDKEDKKRLQIPLQKIDASKMTLEAALKGAAKKPKLLTKILQQNKNRNGDRVKTIMKEASTLLIENGNNEDTRKKLNILTNNIKLFSKKDFNLDRLTLEKLAGFYKNRYNIEVIADILEAQNDDGKEKVTDNIMEELKKGGNAWEQLKYLLDYNNETGISALNLSYETINIPFEYLFNDIKNKPCGDILESIGDWQKEKRIEFTEKALDKLDELNAWLVLKIVFYIDTKLSQEQIKQIFKKFTAKSYLKGMKIFENSPSYASIIVLRVARKIINNSPATAKRFAKEAFEELKTLKDKESIENIWLILSEFGNSNAFQDKELQNEAQQLVNKAFKDNNQNSAHFWELLYFLIADKKGPKVDSEQIAEQLVNKALIDTNRKFEHFWELLYFLIADQDEPKVDLKQIAKKLVNKALIDNNQKFEHFWELLYFLTEDQKGPQIPLQKIDASNMTFETVLKVAPKKPKLLTKILQQNKNRVETIMKEASTLLIEKGNNVDTREKLNILTNNIKLFSKKDFNLDGLTLEKLAGFYKNRYNIEVIADILEAHKKKVTDKIMEELQQSSSAWKHLKYLLDYDNKEGIPALDLSYKTINIPFEYLFNDIKNKPCGDILESIGDWQEEKGIEFTEKALDKLDELNAWLVLKIVFYIDTKLSQEQIKQIFKKFTAKSYLEGMKIFENSPSYASIIVLRVASKIINKSPATAKRFAKEAFIELKTLNDKESIENIWKILSEFGNFSAFKDKQLQNEAQQLVDRAFKDNNQNSVHFWELLYFFIADKKGPKVNPEQIAEQLVNKALIDTNRKFEHFWELLYFLIADQDGPKVDPKEIAKKLVNKALIDNNQKFEHFWELLYFLTKDQDGSQIPLQKIDARNMTFETVLKVAPKKPKLLTKILQQNKNRVETIMEEASRLLINNGSNPDTREKLNILTNNIKLFSKEKFNLDGLTLEILAGFYKNQENIKIITDILEAQNDDGKKKVTDKIMEELQQSGSDWKHLKYLLDYDNKEGIPALDLSYKTIDTTKISKELLINYVNSPYFFDNSFTEIVKNIALNQPSKGLDFIQKALGVDVENKYDIETTWNFLNNVLEIFISDKLQSNEATEAFKPFTVEKYLQAKETIEPNVNNKGTVFEVTKKILQNSATAKRFAKEAFKELKTLKDKGSIENIWKILSEFGNSNAFQDKELQNEAQQLVNQAFTVNNQNSAHFWELLYFFIADKKGPKVDPTKVAEQLVKKASIDNNQNSAHFWELLYFLIADQDGPKVDSKQIAEQLVKKASIDNNQKFEHFWELLYFLIADKDGPKVGPTKVAEQLVKKASIDNNQKFEHFWELLYFLTKDQDGSQIPLQKIDARNMTFETVLKVAPKKPKLLTKILQQNKNRVETIMEEASRLLINNGSNPDTRKKLNILTNNIKLFSKKDFNLDGLTLEILAGFYKNQDNIKIITDILEAQNDDGKKKVTDKIMEELQQSGSAWKHLKELLDYDNKKGIPALDLSYKTIDTTKISKELLINYVNNPYFFDNSFTEIVKNIALNQPSKGLDFIQKALGVDVENKNDIETTWNFLNNVLEIFISDKLQSNEATEAFKPFTVEKYLQAKETIEPNVNNKGTVFEVTKKILQNSATAERFANKAFTDNNQNSAHFWELLYFLITDTDGPQIPLQKIDASNMTLEAALKGTKEHPDTLKKILENDKDRTKALFEKAVQQALPDLIADDENKSDKTIKNNDLIELLKGLCVFDINKIFTDFFTQVVLEENKFRVVRILKNRKLIGEKPLNLHCFTLEILATFYEKYKLGDNRNIDFMTDILKEQKGEVTDKIMKELETSSKAWEHLQKLLDYNNKTGIPALDLSYETINIRSKLLSYYSEEESRNNIIADMVKKQPKKGVDFIIEAVKHINDKKAWILLHAVFTGLSDVNLKDKFNDNDSIKALPVRLYLTAMESKYMDKNNLLEITKKILEISAKTEQFAKEALQFLKSSGDNDKDKKLRSHIWEILSKLVENHEDIKLELQELPYNRLPWNGVFQSTLKQLLFNNPNTAQELANKAFTDNNQNSAHFWELLYFLIIDTKGPKIDAQQINIQKFDEKVVLDAFSSQGNKKDVIESLLRSHPNQAKELVKEILSDQNLFSKQGTEELLHWLIFDSNTNNQGAIVPLANINITPKRAIEILQSQPSPKLSEILNSAIKTQPSIGKGMLEIAINGQTGSPLDWSNANVNFGLLHLLMLDPNGPQLTIEGADLATLDLSAIERHISKPNALQLFKKILHDANNIDTFNAFRYAIFPSNSNSNNTFDYQNVDWDRTKWASIPALKELIKPIDLPEDIVVKKLQDDGFTHKAIVREIVLASSSNLLEKVLNIAFPNVTVTSTTPTPTIAWPQSISETNWDIVASLTDSKYGIITAKEVIQKVVPDISSSDAHFAENYNLSSVRWGEFDWEAFEGLAEQSNIANFSIQNYLTIAENVLPGLRFVDQEPEVSQIDWDQIKSYKVVNFLIEKEIIPEKILINVPHSLLKQRTNNIANLSLAEADFWKHAQEEESKYYWSFAPYAVGLVLASAIVLLYIFNKQEKKKGSHNEEAKVQTQHNINNRQSKKIRSR